ncbi:serine hydrolase domain-containing protein [Planococcus sp. X10-3]|uniref:serine hydrolase domain-containing protein n=1 Tax=Planococcus sp. X10-3 TaxID=3061240 RepID=UPI003BAFB7EF
MKELVRTFLQNEIDDEVTPGAIIRVRHKGEMIVDEALGTTSLEIERVPVTRSTVYDMASLTKVMVTTPILLQLLERGEIYLHDRVATFVPEFGANGKEGVRLRHLLTHSSGLAAHRHYFADRLTKQQVYEEIYKEELVYEPETQVVYSDLGFIMLMAVIERVTGQRIEEYAERHLFTPMGMNATKFLPDFEKSRYAPTEFLEHIGGHKYGIVHDDNTEFMGGISAHAGLFSTMDDLSIFTQMLENDGMHDGNRILHPQWLEKARQDFTPYSEAARGIGFELKARGAGPIGDLLSSKTFGHTGYTGTSFYIDPERELTIMLLTNRVYFGRQDPIIRLRPRLHNLIVALLDQ